MQHFGKSKNKDMINSTIHSRIEKLFDKNSFKTFNPEKINGFVTGCGKVNGKDVMASFIEPDEVPESIFAGLQDHLFLLEKAADQNIPIVFVLDVPAHQKSAYNSPFPKDPLRLLADKNGMGRLYAMHSKLSGKIPQVAVVLNRMGASMTFPAALCDVSVMLETAGMSIGRQDVVEKIAGMKVEYADLGGAALHYSSSGSIDGIAKDEKEAFIWTRNYLYCLTCPDANEYLPPEISKETLETIIPENPNVAFDTHEVIKGIADAGTLFELRAGIANELITCFVRVEGKRVGVIANNSSVRGGLFFPETCRKSVRFISLCDAFGIPLVFMADDAGFMVGSQVEKAGIIKEASLLFSTIANSVVPKLSLVLRRNYTAGVYAMSGPGFDPVNFIALPGAHISIYGKAVAEKLSERGVDNNENEAISEMMSGAEDPKVLLEMGLLDEVIGIESVRQKISDFLKGTSSEITKASRPIILV